jgi:hypothetical protein
LQGEFSGKIHPKKHKQYHNYEKQEKSDKSFDLYSTTKVWKISFSRGLEYPRATDTKFLNCLSSSSFFLKQKLHYLLAIPMIIEK